ncbi:AAA family ATPase [Methylobrevis albus]|uniref:ATP-binding protein n=1 Tax=Methylobrevis albus TaxID=2793297 RepID=A0A931I2Z7_9HYPH|nr:ATP-binding protein [Methylobrevis albus]MBH0239297.1 ATP-binding protein [Methylobrevis albus]
MDPVRNPFAPGAGTQPPELAGRADILERGRITLARAQAGRQGKSFLLVGLRGVGKTVLLNKIVDQAEEAGSVAHLVETPENKSLPEVLIPCLRRILFRLDTAEKVNVAAKRALMVLKAFAGAIRVSVGEVEVGLGIDPERGVADSGDIEADLPDLFEAVGTAARSRGRSVVLVVDELQYVAEREFSALIMAMHRVAQKQLPVVLVGAGLPQLVALAGKSKSYAERLFDFPRIGPLIEVDAISALRDPAVREEADFTADALARIIELTEGYPYFLQEWGYHAWNVADDPLITRDDVERASLRAIASLDESFFRVRFDRVTPREKDYLFAMSRLGPGPHRSGDVAAALGVAVERIAPTRNSLIRKGMIFSPAHGDTAFTVPMFDRYLQRVRAPD